MGGHMLPSSPFWQQTYSFDVFCRIRTVWSNLGILGGGCNPLPRAQFPATRAQIPATERKFKKWLLGPFCKVRQNRNCSLCWALQLFEHNEHLRSASERRPFDCKCGVKYAPCASACARACMCRTTPVCMACALLCILIMHIRYRSRHSLQMHLS